MSQRKIGDGHGAAMLRLGLKELRNALNPSRESAADAEIGLYGTQTQGEIAEARGGPGQGPEQESDNSLSLDKLRGDAEWRRRVDTAARATTAGRSEMAWSGDAPANSPGGLTMIRLTMWASALCVLITMPPIRLFAQVNPAAGRVAPADAWSTDPRARRARREQAVAQVGPAARDFVETQGDEAVAAIFACSKSVAGKLAEFHASGGLGKLPRPNNLLRAIGRPSNGDDVALWAIQHASALEDPDSFDAFVQNPLEYALGLKQLEDGAAEMRARRMNAAAASPAVPPAVPLALPQVSQQELILVGAGCLILVALWLWRRKQLRQQGL